MRRVNLTIKGFTLIEMLISVALFSIVATIVAAAYLNLVNLDRRTRTTNDLVNNMNFVLDTMERSIRTGSNFSCGSGNGTCQSFTFTDQDGCITTFALTNAQITEAVSGGASGCQSSAAQSLNDPRISISNLRFIVTGVGTSNNLEPQVLMLVSGSLRPAPNQAPVTFSVETAATERGIDI